MAQHLLLVDYENVHKIDLSVLDDSYRAVIFIGASQNPPKAASKKSTAHRFSRVDFHKVAGSGKNALDFHIAFHLGRTFEKAPETVCIVVSRDKGFDPLLQHLNGSGLKCRRVENFEELIQLPAAPPVDSASPVDGAPTVCPRCKKASTVEHLGGRWCSNCGSFASPPDPDLMPSRKPGYWESVRRHAEEHEARASRGTLVCHWCGQRSDMSGGIYDDGEWMCGDCIAGYAR